MGYCEHVNHKLEVPGGASNIKWENWNQYLVATCAESVPLGHFNTANAKPFKVDMFGAAANNAIRTTAPGANKRGSGGGGMAKFYTETEREEMGLNFDEAGPLNPLMEPAMLTILDKPHFVNASDNISPNYFTPGHWWGYASPLRMGCRHTPPAVQTMLSAPNQCLIYADVWLRIPMTHSS